MKFKVKKNLTLPQLKPIIDTEFYIKVLTPIMESKVKPAKGENPARVMEVQNLETQETMTLIASAVIENTLKDEYPDEAYVGKCFAITKHAKRGSGKFNPHTIVEIEPDVQEDDSVFPHDDEIPF